MKKLGCRIAALLLVVCLLPMGMHVLAVGEDEMTETNIPLYHPTTASSNSDDALLAVDGINKNSTYTYWEAEADDTALWWQVDLENAYSINRIELESRKGYESDCKNFEVWASNDENFEEYTVLASQGDSIPQGGIFSEKAATGKNFRYLRVVKTKKEAFTIGEFRAWVLKDKIRYGTQAAIDNTQIPDWEGNGSYQIPEDVLGTDLEPVVHLLGVLNIMRGYPDGNFLPDETISRAEFVTSAIKMTGLTAEHFAGDQTYSDVSPEHWAFGAIETAAAIGLVSGMGDGTFLPDARITTAQAVRVVVTLLGYDVLAIKKGGFSQGYLMVAAELKLLGGIYSSASEAITRGEIANLVYNALHTKVMTTSVGLTQELVKEDYTLMNANFGLYKASGLVTATNLTGLTEISDQVSPGYIKINDVMMACSVPNYSEYIGIPVVYYYKNTDEPEVVFLQTEKNVEIFEIQAEDVIRFDASGELEYFVNNGDDTKKIDISDTADVIYNGKAAKGYDKNHLTSETGTLRLLDVNFDGQIELILVTAVRVHVVKYVNEANEMIALSDTSTPLTYDMGKDSVEIYFAETGAAMAMSDIKAGDVISVMESQNTTGEKMLKIYVSRDSIQGTVKEKTADDILINNKRYTLADCITMEDITIGMKGQFYLDKDGRVAAFEGSNADGDYAYLVATAEETGVDNTMRVKLFTKKGVFEELNCSSKLTVDGRAITSLTALNNHLLNYGRLEDEIHQLIKYKANSKDEVTMIDTVCEDAGTLVNVAPAQSPSLDSSGNLQYNADGSVKMITNSRVCTGQILDFEFIYDPEVVIFSVPDDISREKSFAVMSVATLKNGTTYTFDGYAPAVGENIECMLFTDVDSTTISNRSDILIVDKVVQAVDANGDLRNRLDGFLGGKSVSYFEYDEGMYIAENITQGDILQITLTQANEIKKLRKLFDRDRTTDGIGEFVVSEAYPECPLSASTTRPNTMLTNFYIGYGRVVNREGNLVTVKYVTNVNETLRDTVTIDLSGSKAKLYYYDKDARRDKVRLATANDFVDAESVGEENATMAFFFISAAELYCAVAMD